MARKSYKLYVGEPTIRTWLADQYRNGRPAPQARDEMFSRFGTEPWVLAVDSEYFDCVEGRTDMWRDDV